MSNLTLMSDSVDGIGSASDHSSPRGTSRSWLRYLTDPASLIPTVVGVAVALVGFAMMGIAWAKVAGLVDVWRQMPYVMSAALPGLGLVMTGLVIINVSARRQDSAERARQMQTLTEALRDLQRSLGR